MKRRELLQFPALLAGLPLCCETDDLPGASVSFEGESMRIDLTRAPALRRAGSSARLVDPERKLNLILVQPKRGRFVVMDRPCTHGNGPVAFSAQRQTVQCTCWGRSEFALDGRVLSGPASRPLARYPARLQDGMLIVDLRRRP